MKNLFFYFLILSSLLFSQLKKEAVMEEKIFWLGHDSILIQYGGKNFYFDPYELPKNSPAADFIFISHDHFDHLSLEDLKKIVKESTKIFIPSKWESKVKNLKAEVFGISRGDKKSFDGFEVQVVPAYNVAKQYHPKEYGGVGYILKIGEKYYYHAGDTDFIPEMKNFPPIDVAFLPVSGTYVMNAEEAAEATKNMKIKKAIPMHYGSIVGSEEDAKKFKKLASCEVEILTKHDF